jgi:hypothetical protein
MRITVTVAITMAMSVVPSLHGQSVQSGRIPVCVQSTTPDTVGTTFVYVFTEQLRASQTYKVVEACPDALFVININTLDPGDGVEAGRQTVSAITLSVENTMGWDYYLTQWVTLTGMDRVTSQATTLIASVDKTAKKALPSIVDMTKGR